MKKKTSNKNIAENLGEVAAQKPTHRPNFVNAGRCMRLRENLARQTKCIPSRTKNNRCPFALILRSAAVVFPSRTY